MKAWHLCIITGTGLEQFGQLILGLNCGKDTTTELECMGRYDFRSQRAYDAARDLISSRRLPHPPPWYNTVANIPPTVSQLQVRPAFRYKSKRKKASRLFQPIEIRYPEDHLRSNFFAEHPWELARPRIILESDGKDYQYENWERMIQSTKKLDGESVVQRQVYLIEENQMNRKEAYDQARKEFYAFRHREDIQRRVAREEALNTGAYFGPSQIDIGIQLEGTAFEDWKQWAQEESLRKRQEAAAMYTDLEKDKPSASPEVDEIEPQPEDYEGDESTPAPNGNQATTTTGNTAEL